jgi:hypothetical protein
MAEAWREDDLDSKDRVRDCLIRELIIGAKAFAMMLADSTVTANTLMELVGVIAGLFGVI